MVAIALIGTCDTKLEELLYLRSRILAAESTSVILIDLGRTEVDHEAITIKQNEVLKYYDGPPQQTKLSKLSRGDLIKHMIQCGTALIRNLNTVHHAISGIIAAGGSGGTSLASAIMREGLPIGFPKLIVSTIASGDTRPVVGQSDITLMYSVVDIAGSNSLLENIFQNAAGAIVGMARFHNNRRPDPSKIHPNKKRVGITMFGVTTPCVNKAREVLESRYNFEVFVFHATGTGGQAMERLVRDRWLDAVLDITTTEICDYLAEGNMSAGPHRLEAAASAGIPYIVSVGACDMVNFGPRSTVPERYLKQERLFLEHNPAVTLMRTSQAESKNVGTFIADKLTKFAANPQMISVVLPLGGVSMLDTPGNAFANPDADEALFDAIENGLRGSQVTLIRDQRDINDEGFAIDIAERLAKLV